MSNGSAYALVPQALRETGRTISDIAGIEAQSRVARGREGLEETKLRYELGKDVREQKLKKEGLAFDRYNATPMLVEEVLKTHPGIRRNPKMQKQMLTVLGPVLDRTVTPGKLVEFLQGQKAATAKRKQEVEDRNLALVKDFTPASVEKFKVSKNIGDLERRTEKGKETVSEKNAPFVLSKDLRKLTHDKDGIPKGNVSTLDIGNLDKKAKNFGMEVVRIRVPTIEKKGLFGIDRLAADKSASVIYILVDKDASDDEVKQITREQLVSSYGYTPDEISGIEAQ